MLDVLRKCMNWRVMLALAVVGIGIWTVAPAAVATALPFLVVLICPLSMVMMMGAMGTNTRRPQRDAGAGRSVDSLIAQRAQLDAEIRAVSMRDESHRRDEADRQGSDDVVPRLPTGGSNPPAGS